MEEMTAAHRWLPFETVVRVENLDNDRATEVRITDRGPFVDDRILDLSRAAARALDMLGPGTANVRVEILEMSRPAGCFVLQIGAYREPSNARAARDRLRNAGLEASVEPGEDGVLRVVGGPFDSLAEARSVRDRHGGYVRGC